MANKDKPSRYVFQIHSKSDTPDIAYILDKKEKKIYMRWLVPAEEDSNDTYQKWYEIPLFTTDNSDGSDWAVVQSTSSITNKSPDKDKEDGDKEDEN